MRIALCDDNGDQLYVLRENAKRCVHWQNIALEIEEFTDGRKLIEAVRSGKEFEFIFLDIKMPGMSGFEVFARLTALCDSSIIFVSGHTEFLPEAYTIRSCGFLVKPYNHDTFDRTVKSVIDRKTETQLFRYIYEGAHVSIPCREVLLFSIKNYMLTMHCTDGEPIIITNKNLEAVEHELISNGFFRCSRSILVNLRHCANRIGNRLVIDNSSKYSKKIEISRRRLKEYDKQLTLFKMGSIEAIL
jgi:DNA-binding LytR/AlgR family response regulator